MDDFDGLLSEYGQSVTVYVEEDAPVVNGKKLRGTLTDMGTATAIKEELSPKEVLMAGLVGKFARFMFGEQDGFSLIGLSEIRDIDNSVWRVEGQPIQVGEPIKHYEVLAVLLQQAAEKTRPVPA